MGWNDPDNKTGNNDPWTGRKRPEEGPPDIDEALRKLHQRLSALLGKKGSAGGGKLTTPSMMGSWLIIGVLAILWFLSGIFIVQPGERGVVLRFGKYAGSVGPGPHWLPRFIERVIIVNEQKISSYPYEAEMLTKDTNIVHIKLAIQYRIANARDALFEVTNVHESLRQATASALRQVIGHTTLDAILTVDREKVREEVKDVLVQTLQRYNAGLMVTDVALQEARAPDAVRDAFEDVNKAQEDEKRFINQAQAYAKRVEPIARGQAQRLLADAEAYKQQVVLRSKGEVARFLALLPQYQQNPAVMKERLYLDTIEAVLSSTTKIVVDTHGNNNMLYLPLDKLMHSMPAFNKPEALNIPLQSAAAATLPAEAAPAASQTQAAGSPASAETATGYDQKGGY